MHIINNTSLELGDNGLVAILGSSGSGKTNGSIITFHDSLKAEKNMKYALPRAIEWLLEQGYEFKVFD